MRLQILLTPTESKKLLAKAVAARPDFRRAFEEDIAAIHPCTTTYFIMEELGVPLPSGMFVCGLVQPKGLCASGNILDEVRDGTYNPKEYRSTWVFEKGQLVSATEGTLEHWLGKMGPKSVYVKSANLIDPQGRTGVLFSAKGGGTINLVARARKERNFTLLVPTGLEKYIPTPLAECSKAAPKQDIVKAHGTPCGVMPVDGELITEPMAFQQLCGVQAIPVSAGGIGGAEGAIVFMLIGERDALKTADRLLEEVKGAELPPLYLKDCRYCPREKCHNSRFWKDRVNEW